jgi:hypothetical protein
LKGKTETEKKNWQKKTVAWAAAYWPPVQRAGCATFQPAPLEAGHRSSQGGGVDTEASLIGVYFLWLSYILYRALTTLVCKFVFSPYKKYIHIPFVFPTRRIVCTG